MHVYLKINLHNFLITKQLLTSILRASYTFLHFKSVLQLLIVSYIFLQLFYSSYNSLHLFTTPYMSYDLQVHFIAKRIDYYNFLHLLISLYIFLYVFTLFNCQSIYNFCACLRYIFIEICIYFFVIFNFAFIFAHVYKNIFFYILPIWIICIYIYERSICINIKIKFNDVKYIWVLIWIIYVNIDEWLSKKQMRLSC